MESQFTPQISPRDRLGFTLFIAVSLHAALILGITFAWQGEISPTTTIEITLATHNDKEAPENADFAAQANQLGSGNSTDILEKTTTDEADFHSNEFNTPMSQVQSSRLIPQTSTSVITVNTQANDQIASRDAIPEIQELELVGAQQQQLLDLSLEIASLEARLDSERQRDANRPRIRRLTSVSARKTSDAYYLNAWTRKVVSVGNLNYPGEARRRNLYGELRLLVSITPDGALHEVSVLESSGHKVLDDAAMRIVRLAAPFAPFPDEMRKSTDVLEIIRTWQFRKGMYSSS